MTDNTDKDSDEAQQRLDQLNDALLEAYAAGFAKGAEFVDAEPDFDTEVETLKQKEPVHESHYYYWDGQPSRIELWLREQVDDPDPELVTDGGVQEAPGHPYDSWFDGIKGVAEQFEDENEDLEAELWGDLGFHTFFVAEGDDPTRGVKTAIYASFAEAIEEVHIDAEIVEMRYGEVTPEAVRECAIDQMEEHTYLSSELRAAIGEGIEKRVAKNMENLGAGHDAC